MNGFLQTYNDISLRTNSETKRLELRDIEGSGTDYYCTLVIESSGFSAASRFQFNGDFLLAFLKDLNEMDVRLTGKATLKDYFYKDHITFEMLSTGRVFVSGLLANHGEYPQSLEFCFQTDQTVLKPLIEDFDKYLKFG